MSPFEFKPSDSNPPVEQPKISDAEVASATEVSRKDDNLVWGTKVEEEKEGLAAVYAEKEEDKQKAKCLEEIAKILKKHDGMESNIGLKHEYWDLTALYRKLNQNP